MNEKKLLKKLLSMACLLTVIALAACSSVGKKTDKMNEYQWTTAKAGLVFREKPDPESVRVDLIPFATKIYCIERLDAPDTINGITGSWTRVKWNSRTGWVFGGYLAKDEPVTIVKFYDPAWVTAKGGLVIRKNYSADSEKIALVPFGSMVYCKGRLDRVEEIGGVKGSWARVEWNKLKGWAFSGHLRSYKPGKLTAALRELEKTARSYYSTHTRTAQYNPASEKIEITQVLGRYAVVEYNIPLIASENIVSNNAVWENNNGKWTEFSTSFDTGFSAILLYLNNDTRPDLIISEGCCSNGTVTFLLGSKEGYLSGIEFSPSSYYDYYFVTTGRCGDTLLEVEDKNTWKNYMYKFDCATDSIVMVKSEK